MNCLVHMHRWRLDGMDAMERHVTNTARFLGESALCLVLGHGLTVHLFHKTTASVCTL